MADEAFSELVGTWLTAWYTEDQNTNASVGMSHHDDEEHSISAEEKSELPDFIEVEVQQPTPDKYEFVNLPVDRHFTARAVA